MANGDITYFLKILGAEGLADGGGGGAAPPAPEKGGGAFGKKVANELQKGNKGQKKGLGATLGIKFGIASLLKQSQVFTGFVGTIFQLMGALVDVILAPFLPILIPGIMLIAKMVPYVAKYAQMVYDFIDRTIFQWFRNLPISDKIKSGVTQALSAILVGVVFLKFTGMWNVFKTIINTFLTKPIWGLLKKMFPQIDTLMGKFAGKTFGEIVQIAGKAVIKAIVGPWWDLAHGKLGTMVDFLAAPFKLLWAGIKTGAEKMMGATLDDLVRRVWTNGLKSNLVTPLMTRLTGIAGFIAAPFSSLWRAITGNVDEAGTSLVSKAWTAFKRIPLVQAMGRIGSDITSYMKVLADWFMALPFLTVIKKIPEFFQGLFDDIPRIIKGLPIVGTLTKFLEASLKKLLEKAGGLFGKAFGAVKGAAGFVKGKVGAAADIVAPKAASIFGKLKPSVLLNAAKGFKAIPVLGAVAELGFGAYATYKDFKKYGIKAAGGRALLTLANTTAALFDPTGLASAGASIGTNVAMDIAYKKMLDPKDSWKRDNPDIWVQESDPTTGDIMYRKKTSAEQDAAKHKTSGVTSHSVSMDESYGNY